ncbi:MAG: methyltransferase [Verrucomicrobiota bacterium]
MNLDRHSESVRARFSAAAKSYDAHAEVQKAVAERLAGLLPKDLLPGRILEVGCGTGLLTKHLLKRFPNTSLDALDLSERMIQRAKARFPEETRIRWLIADAAKYQPRLNYPLIASSCSLHWLPDLVEGMRHIAGLLETGGTFAFAIMVYGTLSELREARLRVAPHKPPLRRLPTASEVRECVRLSGLTITQSEEEYYPSLYPSGRSLLTTLHDQGLTGGEISHAMLPLNRQEIKDLAHDYEEHYARADGEVVASFRVLFVVAIRAAGGSAERH